VRGGQSDVVRGSGPYNAPQKRELEIREAIHAKKEMVNVS